METLDRLTYVHDGEFDRMGELFRSRLRVIRFGIEGSGMVQLPTEDNPGAPSRSMITRIPVRVRARDELATLHSDHEALAAEAGFPCLLGHSGADVTVLLSPRSLASCDNPAELRGKIRFALARVGWDLPE